MRPSRHLVPPYLLAFLAAAELGSIAAAAEKLHLTHSAISKRVRALERTLGTQLFLRGGARLEPTTAGRRLLTYATQVATLERALQSDLAQMRDGQGGEGTPRDASPGATRQPVFGTLYAQRPRLVAAGEPAMAD